MPGQLFGDRRDAGRVLGRLLKRYRGRSDVVVLALPRGGVPVAYEVARFLEAPLDVFVVRKLGVPGHEEMAMGAIAGGGAVVINDDVIRGLRIPPEVIERVTDAEGRELQRQERTYRGDRPPPDVAGKAVVLVDDGLATGSSMRAAIHALRQLRPARIVVALPAVPESTWRELTAEVDEVVCATTPSPFFAVGQSYWDLTQTTDDEVRQLLSTAWKRQPTGPRPRQVTEADAIRSELRALEGGAHDLDVLLDIVADAHFVLLGQATHGTHEFYAERARLTQRLIEEQGFCAVAAEADWPDAYRVNQFVRDRSDDVMAEEALRGFEQFPAWMWRNTAVLDFVGWLRERNDRVEGDERTKVGFYGLDLYSLFRSIGEIISYLERVDPAAAARARERYSCFDHYNEDAQNYGFTAALGAGEPCETEAVEQLVDIQRHALEFARRDGLVAEDEAFYAEQNARTVRNAEEYYRTMFGGRLSSWNVRDRHMAETLDALAGHLGQQRGEAAKIVVWAHNSHVGDARATEPGAQGELNVGQLARERHPGDVRLFGYTTYAGTVTAAESWGGPAERMRLRPALTGSVEELFHETGEKAFLVPLAREPAVAEELRSALLQRAIGVIYRPRTERQSHYSRARVPDQFDALVHIDETRAVEPLERTARWERGEVPETYPHTV